MSGPLYFPIQSIRLHSGRFTRGYSFKAHVQPFHQFYCVLDGEISQRVGSVTYPLSPGQGVWIAPGLEREPVATCLAGEYLVIEFNAPWPKLGAGRDRLTSLDEAALTNARAMAALRMVTEDRYDVAIWFHHLCLQILPAEYFAIPWRMAVSQKKALVPGEERVERIESMLAANAGNPLQLNDIAALVGMSRSALGRLFQEHRGKSPCACFRDIRLERARELLARGDLSVTEVAMETGFASSQHLAGVFRRKFGRHPSDFRGRRGTK
jgi:AraC-like DNA-binding protein